MEHTKTELAELMLTDGLASVPAHVSYSNPELHMLFHINKTYGNIFLSKTWFAPRICAHYRKICSNIIHKKWSHSSQFQPLTSCLIVFTTRPKTKRAFILNHKLLENKPKTEYSQAL